MRKEHYISDILYQCLTIPNTKYGVRALCKHGQTD